LSWSHYVFLLGAKNADERSFYEIEATNQNWTVRELKRQFNSGLYERLALSRDKEGIRRLAQEGQIVAKASDLFEEPLVLEFLGLDERSRYSESDLESAIISQIERFLLEMGRGFLFESRQKRFTFDEDHFFVDLVFYNRLLRCYVLLDLKIGKIAHQGLGQMQMYVNDFDRFVKTGKSLWRESGPGRDNNSSLSGSPRLSRYDDFACSRTIGQPPSPSWARAPSDVISGECWRGPACASR
jgi:predicted nuclease of restriction endonuclease-like (RecB) superfamily